MSYPLSVPTPSQLAPLKQQANARQVAQLIESNGPTMFSYLDTSTLETIAVSASLTGTSGITTKKSQPKGTLKH
jgi:phage protein U